MSKIRSRLLAVMALLVIASGCNTDPEVAKRRYVENGNKYYDQGLYSQASIMYRNALKRDQRYGEAWYRLGLTQLKQEDLTGAYGSFRRAVELQPENLDARAQVGDILFVAYRSDARHRDQYMDELQSLIEDPQNGLVKRFPGSFETLRLQGSLLLIQAGELYSDAGSEQTQASESLRAQGLKKVTQAIELLTKANSLKPNDGGVVLSLAQSLAATQNFDKAEKLVQEMLKAKPQSAMGYQFLLTQYVGRNRLDDAEKLLQQAVQANPQSDSFALQLAAFLAATKKTDESRATLEAYVKRADDPALAHIRVGDYWARLRNFDEALSQYRSALATKASSKPEAAKAEIQKRMADALLAQNRVAEAKKIIEEVLKANPNDAAASTMHASLLLRGGSRDEVVQALSELESAISRAPNNHVLHYNLANAYLSKNPPEPERARVQLEEAIKLRGDYLPAYRMLTQLLIQQGKVGEAEGIAKKGLEQNPNYVQLRELLALSQIELKNYTAARTNLQEVLKRQPNAIGAQYQTGRLDLAEGKLDDAEKAFRQIYENNPADPLVRGLAGLVETYKQRKQLDKAIALIEGDLKQHPDRFASAMLLGDTCYFAGQFRKAGAQFDQMLAKYPNNPDLWARRGETARLEGDINKAVDCFKKAAELSPERKAPYLLLGIIYTSLNDPKEARKNYQKVLERDPNDAIALNNLAFILVENGEDLDQALAMVQRAKQRLPQNSEISDTLGWIYLKKNLHDNARQIFQELTASEPQNPTFQYHLGMAYFQGGDRVKARQALQSALKAGPNKDQEQKIKELLSRIG